MTIERFAERVGRPVSGENFADIPGYAPATGNASADVAARQYRAGTPGIQIPGGTEDMFLESFRNGQFYGLPTYTPSWYSSPLPVLGLTP
jgi:hypothetical protein